MPGGSGNDTRTWLPINHVGDLIEFLALALAWPSSAYCDIWGVKRYVD